MPDENRVFDVTRPSQVNPSATSKPVIVGHHPKMSDPMVREDNEPTRIPVNTVSEPAVNPFEVPATPNEQTFSAPTPAAPPEPASAFEAPALFSEPEPSLAPLSQPAFTPPPNNTSDVPAELQPTEEPIPPVDNGQHIEGLHMNQPRKKRKWSWVVLVLLLLLVGAYLLIDAGVVGSSINLPIHVFKQKTAASSSSSSSSNNANTPPAVPNGFKEYNIANTDINFAAPIAWGNPTSAVEPGYSMRGGSNQSDGTYAYLVSFATNKDIQIAVTSSKYLPVTRGTLYYDYLKWCTGTNDGKIYESIMHFTTSNKVDTPSTITCDQGPVPSAVKIDASTILQPKAQDTSGKIIGDIYTMNLTDPSLVVFRVKDAATTNGNDIKTLLSTVKVTQSSSSSSSSNSSQ